MIDGLKTNFERVLRVTPVHAKLGNSAVLIIAFPVYFPEIASVFHVLSLESGRLLLAFVSTSVRNSGQLNCLAYCLKRLPAHITSAINQLSCWLLALLVSRVNIVSCRRAAEHF